MKRSLLGLFSQTKKELTFDEFVIDVESLSGSTEGPGLAYENFLLGNQLKV